MRFSRGRQIFVLQSPLPWKKFGSPTKLFLCEIYHLMSSFCTQKSYHSTPKTRNIKTQGGGKATCPLNHLERGVPVPWTTRRGRGHVPAPSPRFCSHMNPNRPELSRGRGWTVGFWTFLIFTRLRPILELFYMKYMYKDLNLTKNKNRAPSRKILIISQSRQKLLRQNSAPVRVLQIYYARNSIWRTHYHISCFQSMYKDESSIGAVSLCNGCIDNKNGNYFITTLALFVEWLTIW